MISDLLKDHHSGKWTGGGDRERHMYSMQPATWASPWDHKEVDTMKCLSLSLFIQPSANKIPPGVKFKGTANKKHQDKCHKSQITMYSHPSCYRNNDDSWLFINKRYKNKKKIVRCWSSGGSGTEKGEKGQGLAQGSWTYCQSECRGPGKGWKRISRCETE